MSAMVKSIDLGKCPMLNNWIGERENLMAAYTSGLRKYIPQLLSAQANMEGGPSADFEAVGAAVRLMGCLCNDMTIIQQELYG